MRLTPVVVKLRVNLKAREWCKLPYPDHPNGCPNYGKRVTCPPDAPLIYDFLDLDKPVYLISVQFDLASHIEKMLSKHPAWSERQARCVLYWQGSVNKELKTECDIFKKQHPEVVTTICPEAMGVNVIETARWCGFQVDTKPAKTVYKIALAGEPKNESMRQMSSRSRQFVLW